MRDPKFEAALMKVATEHSVVASASYRTDNQQYFTTSGYPKLPFFVSLAQELGVPISAIIADGADIDKQWGESYLAGLEWVVDLEKRL